MRSTTTSTTQTLPGGSSRPDGGGAGPAKRGITTRSVVIGLMLSAVLTCWIVYEEAALLHVGVAFTSFMLVQSSVALLFLLLVLNSVLKRTMPSLMFSPAELMVIFCTTTISSIIAGFDLLQNLFPVLLWPYYYAGSDPNQPAWVANMPKWCVPQDPAIVKEFFTGSHSFWRFFSPDVLKAWAIPMTFWMSFLLLLTWTMMCVASIMRRQWVDREKLTFPILELPLTMARGNTVGSLMRNRLFLIGFLSTSALLLMNCLSALFPSVPGVTLNITNIGKTMFVSSPWSGMNPVFVAGWPYAIGLCYLIPLDVAFSSWFFYVVIRLAACFGTAQGWRDPGAGFAAGQFPWYRELTYGAWIAVFVVVMCGARTHLAQVWRAAMSREKAPGDDREPMSYRTALFGAIGGFALLVGIAVCMGLKWYYALLFFSIYFLAIVVMTRIYSQIAAPLFELWFFNATPLMTSLTGTSGVTYRDATVLTSFYWFNRCYRQHPMGHELESIAFAEKLGQRTRPMVWIILAALLVGILVGTITLLQLYYDRGAASARVNSCQVGVGWESFSSYTSMATGQHPPQLQQLATIGASALLVIVLSVMRNIWCGFPLHPIGYALACSYAMEYIWAIVMFTWLVKLLVVRYGGLKTYRQSLPLFFGIMLGDAVTQVVWSIAMAILRMPGASPYLNSTW